MMKKAITWLGIIAFAIGMNACSQSTDIENGDITPKDALIFQAKVNGSLESRTRAVSYSYYPNGTKLQIGVISNNQEVDKAIDGKREASLLVGGKDSSEELTPTPILYWNDLGAKDASINIWGLYSSTGQVTSTERGAFAWKVAADQQAGVLPYDVHWSNNVKALGWKQPAELIFTHAMSKITLRLTVGEGFTAADAATTLVTYPDNFTTTDADASTGICSNVAGKTTITPAVLTPFNGGMTGAFEAIVVPTRKLAIDDVIAIVKIGTNTYYIRSKEERTFESGKNYIYEASVKKTGVAFVSAIIKDWDEVPGSADAQIIFSAGSGSGITNGIGPEALNNATNGFNIFTSHDNSNYDADASTNGTQPVNGATWVPAQGNEGDPNYVPGHWATDVPQYWGGDNDDTYFRALSSSDGKMPESDNNGNFTLNAGSNDFIWGTSGNEATAPNTSGVQLDFKHVMTKVVFNVTTTDGPDAVDLSTITLQQLTGIATQGKFNIASGAFTDTTIGDYTLDLQEVSGSNGKKYTYQFYAIPQEIGTDATVHVTVGNAPLDNPFYQQLLKFSIDGQPISRWESGKCYIYTLILKKTKIEFTAKLVDWEEVYADSSEAEL